ncbi:MAG: hypothetical protein D6722_27840 [Bacteroidetes bacterium]|nr:MAG: hypothetical protein D6722_27840 [Bacteroidota bacterium]
MSLIPARAGRWAARLILPLLAAWSFSVAFTFPEGRNLNRIWSDMEGYYAYLPAVFIYGSFDRDSLPLHTPQEFKAHPETGRINLRFTYGVALMEAPFFGLAHLITKRGWFRTKKFPTGFTQAYSDALVAAALVYTFWGLWLLMGLVRQQQGDWAAVLLAVLLFWGSNLWFYAVVQSGMSHAYSFFLFAVLVWHTPRWLARPSLGNYALMGALVGLITLLRPTNAVVVLYPLLAGVTRWPDFTARLGGLLRQWPGLLLAAGAVLLLWLPQFAYWHHISGQWLYDSYEGYGFTHLLSPRLGAVLFSPRNGWWVYSPLMILPVLAVFWALFQQKGQGLPALLPLLLTLYLCGSWFEWWFGSSYGFRPVIEYYALMALPMMGLLVWAWQRLHQTWQRGLLLLPLLLGIAYSLRMGYLYRWYWSHADWTWEKWAEVMTTQFF